ncbi:hypothetical protein ZOSMA_69G00970 [Zostera marina]|uniref:Uncharacterized protein n=1 Tax=Zostera marina TaxID=29655 RepID=A0A0K9NRI8_ZOSMR|nr:hypothetical protein ZOSMA_69G00970 [Zostera marina]
MLHRNIDGAAKLFVVQPRLRLEPLLQGKLSEALNLASSLNDRRNGDNDEVEEDKNKITPPHIIVQNPLARSKGCAGSLFGPLTFEFWFDHFKVLLMDFNFVR